MTTIIRPATSADIQAAAQTLAAAFDTYPWTRWSIPEDGYAARLERLQAVYLEHAIAHGIVLVSDDLAGVAAMLPPRSPEPAAELQAEVADLMGDRLGVVFGAELPERQEESWDFATVGVRPDGAGSGLGSLLIAESLARAAASAFPRVSLETSSERNVRLYERHGFAVSHRTEIADGPVVFTMAVEL